MVMQMTIVGSGSQHQSHSTLTATYAQIVETSVITNYNSLYLDFSPRDDQTTRSNNFQAKYA